jgi:hypothetical protein
LTAPTGTNITAFAGVTLSAGTDPTVADANYTNFMNSASDAVWDTIAFPVESSSIAGLATTYIKNLRENDGRGVQAVVLNYNAADYEGIISVDQGYRIGTDEEVPPESFVCYVAGATAGAAINQSNTYKLIPGATEIINPKTNDEIEEGLTSGKLMLTQRQDRSIVIIKDINTLVNFSQDRSYVFSKNRPIRTLDDIGTTITIMFENNYIGKIDNNDSGRTLFKGDIIGYLTGLNDRIGAIQNFEPSDVEVLPGPDIESVIVNLWIQVVDSMEKCYLTVYVQ